MEWFCLVWGKYKNGRIRGREQSKSGGGGGLGLITVGFGNSMKEV